METMELENIYQPLYDTIYLPSALSEDRASGFILPLGQSTPVKYGFHVKTENDTNCYLSAMLDSPKTFLVDGIECYFVDDEGVISAKSKWYAESTIALFVGHKLKWQSSIAKCAALASIVNMDKEVLLSKGDFDELRAESKFKRPIEIRIMEMFKVEVTFSDWCMNRWENRTSPSKLCVYLNGFLQLPAQ